jgi:uncharacterized protein
MKVFFDTNVYIAEALLGEKAEAMVKATLRASWRIHCSEHVLDEVDRVLRERFQVTQRFARLTRERCRRRSIHAEDAGTRHAVPDDPHDSPILRAAVGAGVDLLVTNDRHLLQMNPYHGVRIVSMAEYHELLISEGMLTPPA